MNAQSDLIVLRYKCPLLENSVQAPRRSSFEGGGTVSPRGSRDTDYERLLEFRTGLRTFLKWSKDQAAKAGLPPAQHQLLLAIRGHPDHERGPTIGEVSQYLLIRPHTAAELATRAAAAGLVERVEDPEDARLVRVRLTSLGARKLESITEATLEELDRLGPRLRSVWDGLERQMQG